MIQKARGDLSGAISELNKYLSVFMADEEAWAELSALYISLQKYSQAAFCMEELILAAPQNYILYGRYGEIQYTMRQFELARSYFARSIELHKTLRSLLGLVQSCLALARKRNRKLSVNLAENHKLLQWAVKEITELYKQSRAGSTGAIVISVLQQQVRTVKL